MFLNPSIFFILSEIPSKDLQNTKSTVRVHSSGFFLDLMKFEFYLIFYLIFFYFLSFSHKFAFNINMYFIWFCLKAFYRRKYFFLYCLFYWKREWLTCIFYNKYLKNVFSFEQHFLNKIASQGERHSIFIEKISILKQGVGS